MNWDFGLRDLISHLKQKEIKRVLIQLPEGLKPYAKEIMDELESQGVECTLSGDPCYGACDLRTLEGYTTVHFGHEKLLNDESIYIPVTWKGPIRFPENIENKKVGVLTTVQHKNHLNKLKSFLEAKGCEVIIGGTVLGCRWNNADKVRNCDLVLFYGSGIFHALGIAYYLRRKVLVFDPITGERKEVDWISWEREKQIRRAKAEECDSFGIVVSTKPGQMDLETAERLKRELKNKDKKAYVIVMDEITPEKLDYLPFDCFVITACPRIVLDDWKNYKKPVILPDEIPRE
jgi:2-(3-amino-3-carboxypropyl)histidine synthase